jgi:hypothetical protein
MYRHLDQSKIIATLEKVNGRIRERFPDSGLSKVSLELLTIGRDAQERCKWISRPHWELRLGVYFLIGLILVSFALAVARFDLSHHNANLGEFVQFLEAGINDLIYVGAAIVFLVTVENRIKRKRILELIHELRSVAHVIDMHQLTKDPEILLNHEQDEDTASPQRVMSPLDLERYLDYCSEMLSLIGKIAALYIQDFDDSAAVESVNEIEVLTNGLSRKIWQKISILHAYQ